MIALAENFGGTRLYIPYKIDKGHPIAEAIGLDAAKLLSKYLSPDTIRVPLARELRARSYRRRGESNARIAVRLGMTETAIDRLFKRLKGQADQP